MEDELAVWGVREEVDGHGGDEPERSARQPLVVGRPQQVDKVLQRRTLRLAAGVHQPLDALVGAQLLYHLPICASVKKHRLVSLFPSF